LELADHGATGGVGSEDLGEEEPEGATGGEDAFAAVEPLIGLGEEVGREEVGEAEFEFREGGLADLAKA
jgi:hypothetical protein